MSSRILIVDDEVSILKSLSGALRDEGYGVMLASSGKEALEQIQKDPPDLVLLDIWMPGKDGLSTLQEIKQIMPQLPVVIISGHGNVETAVKATKLGAFDFVEKPLSLERTLLCIQNALQLYRLEEENLLWRQKALRRWQITGKSAVVESLRSQIKRAAPANATVLISGENGTGKELVARMLHYESRRSRRPMVEVNCAAIPEELIESELFGHEKGAFTGATERRKGKFDQANGGTLFLDEIGDMSLKTQAKILRIIQEQVFERVGGATPIRVDVRIIAATNKALQKEIDAGRFRQDLFYRLNVIPLQVPALRRRLEDIPLLVEDFIAEYANESTMKQKNFEPAVIAALQRYSWPGNVRELRNFVERLIIMTPSETIGLQDIPEDFRQQLAIRQSDVDLFGIATLREARSHFERKYLLGKLQQNAWNISVTAAEVGIERSHLHRKMKLLGINEESEQLEPDPNSTLM